MTTQQIAARRPRKSDFEKRADRAAQDILNLYAQVCIQLGGWTLPPKFSHKFSKSKLSALIMTRMMEPGFPGSLIEASHD